ncbi:hypothetical protein WDW37_17235 [Bdellovibrionota bacterium FG-1]
MLILDGNNKSQIASCLDAAGIFLLSRQQALDLIENQVKKMVKNWDAVCDLAELNTIDRKLLGSRQFLNPYVFENLGEEAHHLIDSAKAFKGQ